MSLKSICVWVIPHAEQRYNTVGDWVESSDEQLDIYISDANDDRVTLGVAIHELIEAYLCKQDGITQEVVDGFDEAFEEAREHGDNSEPGDDPAAPYYNQHQAATLVEREVIAQLQMSWQDYCDRVLAIE